MKTITLITIAMLFVSCEVSVNTNVIPDVKDSVKTISVDTTKADTTHVK